MINLNLPPRVAAAMRELRSEPGALRFEGIRSVEGALAIGGPIHVQEAGFYLLLTDKVGEADDGRELFAAFVIGAPEVSA